MLPVRQVLLLSVSMSGIYPLILTFHSLQISAPMIYTVKCSTEIIFNILDSDPQAKFDGKKINEFTSTVHYVSLTESCMRIVGNGAIDHNLRKVYNGQGLKSWLIYQFG